MPPKRRGAFDQLPAALELTVTGQRRGKNRRGRRLLEELAAGRRALIDDYDIGSRLGRDRCRGQPASAAADHQEVRRFRQVLRGALLRTIAGNRPLGHARDPHFVLHRRHAGTNAGSSIHLYPALLTDPHAAEQAAGIARAGFANRSLASGGQGRGHGNARTALYPAVFELNAGHRPEASSGGCRPRVRKMKERVRRPLALVLHQPYPKVSG